MGHRQTPAMISDDRPANRQPHSHPVGFRCKERLDDAVEILRIDPRSGVFHGNKQMTCFIDLGLYSKNAVTIRHTVHCVNGVRNQIHDNLLQLVDWPGPVGARRLVRREPIPVDSQSRHEPA